MAREGRFNRRYAVFGAVIVVHALLVELALRQQPNLRIEMQRDESLLIFLPPRAQIPPPTRARQSTAVEPNRSTSPTTPTTPTTPEEQNTGDFAISLESPSLPSSEGLPLRLGVDWEHEATQVADAQAVTLFKALKHVCEQAALRGEQSPGCHRYKKPDAWSPEPKKFGFMGLVPYVRLSKRCVIGLGFFGCGVGHLPEADGHVFDDMRDPDRPRSSVPDPNE